MTIYLSSVTFLIQACLLYDLTCFFLSFPHIYCTTHKIKQQGRERYMLPALLPFLNFTGHIAADRLLYTDPGH